MKRIITGHSSEGKSIFISEDEARTVEPLPGWKLIELWGTEGNVELPDSGSDPTKQLESFTPNPNGTRFRIFTIPPGVDDNDPVVKEQLKKAIVQVAPQVPGLGERMELDNPGMHTTDTIDYVIALSGEAELELDDGAKVHVAPGDCVVQRGTRHAWRNKGQMPFVAACVMIGARRDQKKQDDHPEFYNKSKIK